MIGSPDVSGFHDKKILIVDDDDANIMLSKFSLRNAGISRENVFVAQDGFQAVALAQQQLFDIIIMDINLPGMNGTDAATLIKVQNTGIASPKIIAYTADENTELIQDKGPFDDVMIKPIKRELFIEKIYTTLNATKDEYQLIMG